MFPPQGMGGDPLGGPPPSPTGMNPDGQGSAPASMRGMAGSAAGAGGGPIPSSQLPPEVLTGITAAALDINAKLDSFAQVTPDKQQQLSQIKDLLQQYLADLMSAGAGAVTPTASGPAFPGGGMARGLAGAGAI